MANSATIKNTLVHVGDTVKVYYRIIEKEEKAGKTKKEVKAEIRERYQPFEGTVIAIKGSNENQSFTVRKIGADAVGIERIFPAISPWINKITVSKKGLVRRAKLYYLRNIKNQVKFITQGSEKEKVIKKTEDKKPELKTAKVSETVEKQPATS